MSNANPVKEPSMDEILASIRRIIESGDDRTGSPLRAANERRDERGAQASADADSIAQLLNRSTVKREASVPHVAAPAQSEDAAAPAAGERDARPPASRLADIARLRERYAAQAEASRGAGRERSLDAVGPEIEVTAVEAPAEPVSALGNPGLRGHSGANEPLAGSRADSAVSRPAPTFEPIEEDDFGEIEFNLDFDEEKFAAELRSQAGPEPVAAEGRSEAAIAAPVQSAVRDWPQSREAATASPATTPVSAPELAARARAPDATVDAIDAALISERTGEQVAAAFDDLSRAIREGQMRSMEEMARQMLRPMLQEWLDDNLPHLVERLVREEIERVSRGGRR